MKDDIAQISRMLRSGKLSQEQAAELIDALAAADTTEAGGSQGQRGSGC